MEMVDVLNVDRLSYRVVSDEEGGKPTIIGGQDLIRLWQDVVDPLHLAQARASE